MKRKQPKIIAISILAGIMAGTTALPDALVSKTLNRHNCLAPTLHINSLDFSAVLQDKFSPKDWDGLIQGYMLKIKATQTEEELKRLWKKLVFDVHPDHNPRETKAAGEAFKVLTDKIAEHNKKLASVQGKSFSQKDGLPLWMYDFDFYQKERDGISGIAIMAAMEAQWRKNAQDIRPQMDIIRSLVVGDIVHIRVPLDFTAKVPDSGAESSMLMRSPETTVVRAMVIAPFSDEQPLQVMPIETAFFGAGDFVPRVAISVISQKDILANRVVIIREPIQEGDFSIKIGDQVEIYLYDQEKWQVRNPAWARATVISNAWGMFTLVAHRDISRKKTQYDYRLITLDRRGAEEMLANNVLRIVTPGRKAELMLLAGVDTAKPLYSIESYYRFPILVSRIASAIAAKDPQRYDSELLPRLVERAVRRLIAEHLAAGDERFEIRQNWHKVDRYASSTRKYQKQVYTTLMFNEDDNIFRALRYLGGIALDRVQFGDNNVRYPVEESLECRTITVENPWDYFNRKFKADGKTVDVYKYSAIIAEKNGAVFKTQSQGAGYVLSYLEEFVKNNPGPYQLVTYAYGKMLDDYQRDGFFLEASEPLIPFQQHPAGDVERTFWNKQAADNLEYLKARHTADARFYPRIFSQVTQKVNAMIEAGLYLNYRGWNSANWQITPGGEAKLYTVDNFKMANATNNIITYPHEMAEAIVEWVLDFRTTFGAVSPELDKKFVAALKKNCVLFRDGRIAVPDEKNKDRVEDAIESFLQYSQTGTITKRQQMKPVPVLMPEELNLDQVQEQVVALFTLSEEVRSGEILPAAVEQSGASQQALDQAI